MVADMFRSEAMTHARHLTRVSALASALLACACATTPPTNTASAEPAAPALQAAPPEKPWAELSFEERKAHMRDAVVPVMTPLFLAHDEDRYANFGCRTCHGPDARAQNYAMPSPSLRTLFPSGSREQIETVEQHRAMAVFMFQRVTPTMRTLLGAPTYDADTGAGFTCFYCHPRGEPAEPLTPVQAGETALR